MKECQVITKQVRRNWWMDAALFIAGLGAALTGVYFLALPVGGYQGGRNPTYGITILFDRHTWDTLHAWTGVAMIVAVLIHLVWHWSWIKGSARRIFEEVVRGSRQMSSRSRINIGIDAIIAVGFLLSAVSGIYFLLGPGETASRDLPSFIFSSGAWDVIHTWSSVAMIIGIMAHLVLHWSWIKSVSARCLAPAEKNKIHKQQSETPA